MADLTGRALGSAVVTGHDDRYLLHRDSVVSPEEAWAVAEGVAALCREHPDAGEYFVPLGGCRPRRLSRTELEERYDPARIVAAHEVPERSVQTLQVADHFCEALRSCDGIEAVMDHRVLGVRADDRGRGTWSVDAVETSGEAACLGPFDAVVNALWEGREAIDPSVGLGAAGTRTHRYRVSLFATTRRPVDVRSAVVAVGPFGDVKNYDGRHLYVSWYETGLLAEGHEPAPPPVPRLDAPDEARLAREMLHRLGALLPGIRVLEGELESSRVHGGWVYAAGRGALSDRASDLHRRDRVGSRSREGYFSVDTGKYSIAPWLARQVAADVEAVVRRG